MPRENGPVTGIEDLTPVERHVLSEADGDIQLWELAARWTNNGDDEQRRAAVPVLRAAVTRLVRDGLVDVHDFPAWPTRREDATPIPLKQLHGMLADEQNWLWRGESTSLITIAVTKAGVANQ